MSHLLDLRFDDDLAPWLQRAVSSAGRCPWLLGFGGEPPRERRVDLEVTQQEGAQAGTMLSSV
jgi:hypothetical protein